MGNLGWLARDGAILMLKESSLRIKEADPDERAGLDEGRGRIRCPRCGWQPGQHDRWACTCLHLWNTFETGGVCPACGREWAQTQCPRCEEWSRHGDWYADEPGGGER
jgi:hypothetical protein